MEGDGRSWLGANSSVADRANEPGAKWAYEAQQRPRQSVP